MESAGVPELLFALCLAVLIVGPERLREVTSFGVPGWQLVLLVGLAVMIVPTL